jgi:hypothetical protein
MKEWTAFSYAPSGADGLPGLKPRVVSGVPLQGTGGLLFFSILDVKFPELLVWNFARGLHH